MFGLNNGLKVESSPQLLREEDSSQEERNEPLQGRTFLEHSKIKLKLELNQLESLSKTLNVNR